MNRSITYLVVILAVCGMLSACASPASTPEPAIEVDQGDQAEPIDEVSQPESEIFFFSDADSIHLGECTFLRWEVNGGFGAALNGEDVPLAGEKEICPEDSQSFELAVDVGTKMERRELTITVTGREEPQEEPIEESPPPEEPQSEGESPVTPVEHSQEKPVITPGTPAYHVGTWSVTSGPPGGLGYDIRMDPRNPDVMYVTDAFAGVFKSLDGGASWFPINNGITTRVGTSLDAIPVFSLSIDPNNPDTLWAGTQYSSKVFRSDDAGESWSLLNNGIQENSLSIRGLTVEPGNSDIVYLAGEVSSWEWNNEVGLPGLGLDMTKGVVYKTTNGGQNWTRIWYGDNLARYIWIHPDDHNLLYVSTGIFDREAANSDPVALDPGGVGILRSRDGGNTWEELGVKNGIREKELYFGSLFMHPENPDILIGAAGNDPYASALQEQIGAIYLTEDGGDTWERVLELYNASVVEICTSDPDVMYAGSINGVARSDDGGHSWVETAGHLWGSDDVLAGFPIDMQCDPRDPMRIFINNYIGGNFLSEDGGYTWQTASKGYTGALLSQVAVAADDPFHVYSASRMGVFASTDAGDNWVGTAVHPARSPEAIVVAVDYYNPNHIMAVFEDAGPDPKVSWDGGKSWEINTTGLWTVAPREKSTTTRIVFSPYDPNIVLASAGYKECSSKAELCEGEPGFGIILSEDRGQTWTTTSLSDAQVTDIAIAGDALAYAVAYPDTVYRSTDGGRTWDVIAQGLISQVPLQAQEDTDAIPHPLLISIAVDPFDHDHLFVGFASGGVMTSTDGGGTWTVSASGLLPELTVIDIEPDPVHQGVVYLGSLNSGVFYTTDSGANWTILNSGLTTRAVKDLALSTDGSVLYMASEGGGVFQMGYAGE